MRIMLGITVLVAVAVAGCGGTRRTAKALAAGSCQQQCEDQHPASLYDRNRCLETCEPPADP